MSFLPIWQALKKNHKCMIECADNIEVKRYISRKVSCIKDRDKKFKDQTGGKYRLVYDNRPEGMLFYFITEKWALTEKDFGESDIPLESIRVDAIEILKRIKQGAKK